MEMEFDLEFEPLVVQVQKPVEIISTTAYIFFNNFVFVFQNMTNFGWTKKNFTRAEFEPVTSGLDVPALYQLS